MYRIDLDGTTIYNSASPSITDRILSGSLEMGENNAGTLSVTFPPNHPINDILQMYTSTVHVYKDNEWLWSGRCIGEKEYDIFGQLSVTFEGTLAFLNDTHQESVKYTNYTMNEFLAKLLQVHNSKVSSSRRIQLGMVTVDDGVKDRYSEYEGTLEAINDIIEDTKGHLRIRYVGGVYYLDYLSDYEGTNSQYVNFGKNLLDYNSNTSMENFATVILPLGPEDSETGERLTVASVNDGSIYVVDTDAVAEYGWVEKTYDSSEINTASALLSYAKGLLTKSVADINTEFEVSAIDLHNLDNNIEMIRLLDTVRVISKPHNLDREMPVISLTLDLCNPANDSFVLGTSVSTTLTSTTNDIAGAIYKKLDDLPSEKSILDQAKANATALINSATTGYVTVRPNAIYISNNEDYTASSKLWTWNINGLGYSTDGGQTYGLAMTMDGAIVADYITAGTMSANRIRAGTLTSENGNTSWNLNTGSFIMAGGSIRLGTDYGANAYSYLRYSVGLHSSGIFARSSSFYGYLTNGTIYFGRPDDTNGSIEHTGYIDGTANIHYLVDDTYFWGLNIVAPSRGGSAGESIIRLVSDRISVSNSNDTTAVSINTVKEGYIHVLNQADNLIYNLRFINGLLVTSLPSS